MEGSARKIPELLAPAGNRAAFDAAIAAGADAVYLGAGEFNARRNAGNFTPDELAQACKDAHLRGRKVYLTANTLVMPNEMEAVLGMVSSAYDAGIDAAIVQDIGLISTLRRELPDLPIHASTQMNIRDARGIEIAKRLGVSRVTLARELSVGQISELSKLGMPLECFVHGALCICQSGQCLFSSMLGDRSANRGLCAQPCRLPYKLLDEYGRELETAGSYLLSPKDLMGIELLPELIDAGVASLKIEGRMKSPEYVSTVTSVYRAALDRAFADGAGYAPEEGELRELAEAFNRGFTTAYLDGSSGMEMMGIELPNNRGVLIGSTAAGRRGLTAIVADSRISPGDLLEIRAGGESEIHEVAEDDISGKRIEFDTDKVWPSGTDVYRLRSASLAKRATSQTERGLEIPVSISVRMLLGEPLGIELRAESGAVGRAEGPIVEAARTKAVSEQDAIEHVGRLGSTPFVCTGWEIDLSEGVGIGFSTLHKARQEAVEALEQELLRINAPSRKEAMSLKLKRSTPHSASNPSMRMISLLSGEDGIAQELGEFKPGREIGPRLYVTNAEALEVWHTLGAKFAWLSPELTLGQIRSLAKRSPIPLGLVVSGNQELMISCHCFIAAEGPCDRRCSKCRRRMRSHFLLDRKGYALPVTTDKRGRGHIFNAVPLDLIPMARDLVAAGLSELAIDCSLMDDEMKSGAVERLQSALDGKKVPRLSRSTTGHIKRAVR